MATLCRPCAAGDHPDCTRWLMRDHPCRCVCDDAPRQLSLPLGNLDELPGRTLPSSRPARVTMTEEVPW